MRLQVSRGEIAARYARNAAVPDRQEACVGAHHLSRKRLITVHGCAGETCAHDAQEQQYAPIGERIH
jgi:hypothetical protein